MQRAAALKSTIALWKAAPVLHPGRLRAVTQCQCYSSRRPGFLSSFIDNLKQEMEKSKEMKENLKKFREEAQKLEESEALKTARQKFERVEAEAKKESDVLKERFDTIREKMGDVLEEATKTDIAKKASKFGEDFSRQVAEKSQQLGKSEAFQSISEVTKTVQKEIQSQSINAHVYQPLAKLRKRVETSAVPDDRVFEANTDATGMELHKDSKFFESWENFKNNNAYVNKVLSWKIAYDESENPVIRASRVLTEKVGDIMGNLFSKTELSETLTEICKIDPAFDQKKFLRDCETDIIPNILEAIVRGDLEILRDWCFEAPFNLLATPVKQARQLGYYLDSKILDIEGVDLVMGKVMEQGPVLIITFQTQQIMCVRAAKTQAVVEGDPEKVLRFNYVWVLCRDPNELNPRAAWRLMELSASSKEQLV